MSPIYRNVTVLEPVMLQQSQHGSNFNIVSNSLLDLTTSKTASVTIDVAPRFTQLLNWHINNQLKISIRKRQHPYYHTRFIAGNPTQTLQNYTAIANPIAGDTYFQVLLAGNVQWVGGETISLYSPLGGLELNRVKSVDIITDPTKYKVNLEYPVRSTHNAAKFYNMAHSFPPINLTGGSTYELIFDYSDNFSANALEKNEIWVQATALIYDGEQS